MNFPKVPGQSEFSDADYRCKISAFGFLDFRRIGGDLARGAANLAFGLSQARRSQSVGLFCICRGSRDYRFSVQFLCIRGRRVSFRTDQPSPISQGRCDSPMPNLPNHGSTTMNRLARFLAPLIAVFLAVAISANAAPPKQKPKANVKQNAKPTRWVDSWDVPAELANRKLAELGMVDVTAAPFRADPTGKQDATGALQNAITFARDHQMVTFFPAGTYTVSDTLECLHGRWDPKVGKLRNTRDLPCILVGDRSGERRPLIRLAPRSAGFDDPKHRKYVVRFWSYGTGKEAALTELQPNINMNQMLIGIDVTISAGNPGAVGVRHRAAQGSSVQDCTIDARGGLTGLEGGAGSGGSHFNVTVIGGRVGVDYRETQPAPTIAGFTLIDQTEAAILCESRQAFVAVGCRIETNTRGPVIVCRQKYPHTAQLSLIDSVVEFKRPGPNVVVETNAAVTLHNVYVRDGKTIVRTSGTAVLSAERSGWLAIREFAAAVDPPPTGRWTKMPGLQYKAPVYIDGKRLNEASLADVVSGTPPPAELTSAHIWGNDFPSWQTAQAVNVKDAPYGAKGNGTADDADAIQRAVDQREIVFLPKGVYRVSRPIKLRKNTRLLGVGRCYTWLVPLPSDGGPFADPRQPQPIVRTVDVADADCVVAFLGIRADLTCPGAYCLSWQSGSRSIFRAVNIATGSPWSKPRGMPDPVYDFPMVLVSGHGGGRWYNFHQESWHFQGPHYRHLLISGSNQPMHLYQCNPEHARSDANMEIRDAQFVSVYGVKGEYFQPIITVRNSDHIRIFGYGGNAAAHPNQSLFLVENTPNFLATNLVDTPRFPGDGSPEHFAGAGVDPHKWFMLIDRPSNGPVVRTEPLDRPVLYRRGIP